MLRKRVSVLVAAAMVALTMLALSAPAFARGCQAFGVEGVADTAHSGDMGGFATTFAHDRLMDDIIHENQEEFCPGS